MKRVMVAMSGGVDSSVTAALLKEQGFEVVGITMRLIDESIACSASSIPCSGYESAEAAREVADIIGIEHHIAETVEAFKKDVIENFIDEYRNGKTPNPCIRCNQFIKFDFLLKKMDELKCDFMATGHYAKIKNGKLIRGDDIKKDQSYFLYRIYDADINKVLFPLADYTKPEIRIMAEKYKLPVAQKKDSQDICFIPDGNLTEFLSRYIEKKEGDILNMAGEITGRHSGVQNYTIGQRKGLGAHCERVYAVKIDTKNNTVTAGGMDDLLCSSFQIKDTLFNREPDPLYNDYLIQIRYNTKAINSKISKNSTGNYTIKTTDPVRAVTAGQSAVLYDGNEVVGGGIIC